MLVRVRKLAGFVDDGDYLSFSRIIYEPDEPIQRCTWQRELNGGFARMTIYVIGLAILALLYGLFWNNRSASEYARLDDAGSKRDEGATRTRHRSNRSAS